MTPSIILLILAITLYLIIGDTLARLMLFCAAVIGERSVVGFEPAIRVIIALTWPVFLIAISLISTYKIMRK